MLSGTENLWNALKKGCRGCPRTMCWGCCLGQRWRKKQDIGENYIMRTTVIFSLIFFSVIQDMRLLCVKTEEYTNKWTILQYKVDLLQAGRPGDRIPVGARFSAPVQTSPEVHPASNTMGTAPFLEVKRPRHDVDNPPPI